MTQINTAAAANPVVATDEPVVPVPVRSPQPETLSVEKSPAEVSDHVHQQLSGICHPDPTPSEAPAEDEHKVDVHDGADGGTNPEACKVSDQVHNQLTEICSEKSHGPVTLKGYAKLLQEFGRADADKMESVLTSYPGLSMGMMIMLRKLFPSIFEQFLTGLELHPSWNPDNLVQCDPSTGELTINPMIANPLAMQVLNSREDLTPQDLQDLAGQLDGVGTSIGGGTVHLSFDGALHMLADHNSLTIQDIVNMAAGRDTRDRSCMLMDGDTPR